MAPFVPSRPALCGPPQSPPLPAMALHHATGRTAAGRAMAICRGAVLAARFRTASTAFPQKHTFWPVKRMVLPRETYGFGLQNHTSCPAPSAPCAPPLAPNTRLCHAQPTAESCPAPDETAQNGHFPGRRRESGKEGMPTPRGPSARHQQMGSRAMEWAVLAEKASQSPSCPGRGAHRKWLGAWGFSPCGTAVTGTATAASPNPAGKAEARAAKEAGAAWAMGDGKEKGGTASPRAIPSPRDTH